VSGAAADAGQTASAAGYAAGACELAAGAAADAGNAAVAARTAAGAVVLAAPAAVAIAVAAAATRVLLKGNGVGSRRWSARHRKGIVGLGRWSDGDERCHCPGCGQWFHEG
jgi:hypothetical protein